MLHAFVTLAAEAAEAEPSKTAFYLAGGVLVGWAIALSAIGLTQPEFPATDGAKRGVIGLSLLLMALAMITAVATS